jgi:hypothetical protein
MEIVLNIDILLFKYFQSAPGRALFSGNFFVNNAIAGAIELPTLLACVFLMKFGRKPSVSQTFII